MREAVQLRPRAVMSAMLDFLADDDSIINALPEAEAADLEPGDEVAILYKPTNGADAQVVHGCVTGVGFSRAWVLAPRNGGDRDHNRRRIFSLSTDSDEVRAMWAESAEWDRVNGGHVPRVGGRGDWELGETIRVVPTDVDMGPVREPEWGLLRLWSVKPIHDRDLAAHQRHTRTLLDRLWHTPGGRGLEPFDVVGQYDRHMTREGRRIEWAFVNLFGDAGRW